MIFESGLPQQIERMADEHLHLEDILGGVEEEIQRAEARLKKDLLQWSSGGLPNLNASRVFEGLLVTSSNLHL